MTLARRWLWFGDATEFMPNKKKSKRIVIKVGTGVLTESDSLKLDHALMDRLAEGIATLLRAGHQCILVSSGAVATGMPAFDLTQRPEDTASLQACAAVGQARLMHLYETVFRSGGFNVAQLLLTHDDLEIEDRRYRFNNTLRRILELGGTLPIINENDSVAVEELRFGDNDVLSSRVAILVEADVFILMTTVAGLLPPGESDPNNIVGNVSDINEVLHFARDEETGQLSKGGMGSKLRSIQRAVEEGIEAVIADGRNPEQLLDIAMGGGFGTRFVPSAASAGPSHQTG